MSVLVADADGEADEVIMAAQAAKSPVALAVSGGPLSDQPSRPQGQVPSLDQSGG